MSTISIIGGIAVKDSTTGPALNIASGPGTWAMVDGDLMHQPGHLYFMDGTTLHDLLTGGASAADNGLSVSGGNIVLGQDVGGSGGALISSRELPMSGYDISFKGIDTQYTLHHTPQNYGATYSGTLPSTGGPAGRFSQGWATFPGVNGADARPNVVGMMWGYNTALGSAPIVSGEFAFHYGTETYFRQDGTTMSEHHLPEVVDEAGHIHRIHSTYIHRNDGLAYEQNDVNSVEYYSNQHVGSSAAYMSWGVSGTGNATLSLNASQGSGGSTTTGGDGTNQPRFAIIGPAGSTGIDLLGADSTFRADRNITLSASQSVTGGNINLQGAHDINFNPPSSSGNINFNIVGTGIFAIFGGGGSAGVYITGSSFNITSNGLDTNGWVSTKTRIVNTNDTQYAGDHTVFFDAAVTFQLLTAVYYSGYGKELVLVNRSAGAVTLLTASGETLDGLSSVTLAAGTSKRIQSDNVKLTTIS